MRSSEVLWQEGHTFHLEKEAAVDEMGAVLAAYRRMYRDLLAVPLIGGTKRPRDTFAGALKTASLEALLPDVEKTAQACTVHHLAQIFARIFGVAVKDAPGKPHVFPHQNSWGLSMRAIGVAVAMHGDAQGLVFSPRSAPVQIAVVPCGVRSADKKDSGLRIASHSEALVAKLKSDGWRVLLDDTSEVSAGFKFNEHELRGVPLRIEIGSDEVSRYGFTVVPRVPLASLSRRKTFLTDISPLKALAEEMHGLLYENAVSNVRNSIVAVDTLEAFCSVQKPFVLFFICRSAICEESVLRFLSSKRIIFAVDQSEFEDLLSCHRAFVRQNPQAKCIICGAPNSEVVIAGNAY